MTFFILLVIFTRYSCAWVCDMNALLIGRKIALRREKLGMTQTDLASKMNVSPQSVQQWENGKTTPRGKRLDLLSSVLDAPTSYFFDESSNEVTQIKMRQSVPLISWVSAGSWANNQQDTLHEYPQIQNVFDTGKNGYALRDEGESMLPRYHPNDIIFVNPDAVPVVGRRVIAACTEGVTFKELAVGDAGKLVLKALNEQWHPRYMPLDETCYIIGVVVGSVRPE